MGRRFSIHLDNVATNAVADTYRTMLGMFASDVAGNRFKLRAIAIGGSEDAPQDLALGIQVARIDDVSAGGAGTSTAITPEQFDSLSKASAITAGHTYTAEPTAYNTVKLFQMDINLRNSIRIEWPEEDAPVANRDQLIGILCCPRTGAARTLSLSAEFEEF